MIQENEILKIYGTDFADMTYELLARADLTSLIGDKNMRIGIKPNLVCPSPAEFGATTHPQVVEGIIRYLRDNGFEQIVIAEGSWVGDRTSDSYEYCGYRELCERLHVPFIDTQKQGSHPVKCGDMELRVSDVVDDIDFLINVPVLKGHCQTHMTCALKNLKGLIPNTEKRRFHRLGLHRPIAHLQKAIHQDFIVVDHICGDPDFEEGGHPLVRNCVMAALDPVLTDSYACSLLGVDVHDVPYVLLSEELGIGHADISNAKIIDLNGSGAEQAIPAEKKHLAVSYAVDEVDSCSACYANLVPALDRLEKEGLLAKLHTRIAIGQGHQGEKGELGIGKCTKDFSFCVMGCPPDEEKIYRELRRYIEEREGF